MANPVAIYATSIEPPSRRAAAAETDSARGATARPRGAYPRLVYDSRLDPALERLRHADAVRDARARGQDPLRRSPSFQDSLGNLEAENEILGETGRRKASAALMFAAQQIAQEKLSPGLYFENYKPAVAAYTRAASYGAPGLPGGSALRLLV